MKKSLLWILGSTLVLAACGSTGAGSSNNGGNSGAAKAADAGKTGTCRVVQADKAGAGREVIYRCSGNAVLNTAEAREAMLSNVRVSFGGGGGSVIKANDITRQSANRVGRSDAEACERAFLNAVVKFQQTANKLGGSRVNNFYSYYDRKPLRGGDFECAAGTFHARVVMRGDIAR